MPITKILTNDDIIKAVLAERERCAKIVEEYNFTASPNSAAYSVGYAVGEISQLIRGHVK